MNAKLAKILKIVCYVLSVPLFLVFAIIASMHTIEQGGSYGILTYIGIILAIVFSIIWAVIVLLFELSVKKSANKSKKIKRQTIKLVIASFMLTAGVMIIVDVALPGILPDATSSTIYYEDLADNANGRADLNKELLDKIIERSVMLGLLGGDEKEKYSLTDENGLYRATEDQAAYDAVFVERIKKYQKLGMKSPEVHDILDRDGKYCVFDSFNLGGYESFIGPHLDIANDGRMTVPAIVYLVIGQRSVVSNNGTKGAIKWDAEGYKVLQEEAHASYEYDNATGQIVEVYYNWTILDMMGDTNGPALELDLSGVLGEEGLDSFVRSLLSGLDVSSLGLSGTVGGIVSNILNNPDTILNAVYPALEETLKSLPDAVAEDSVAGAPLYVLLVNSEGNTDGYVNENLYYEYFSKDATKLSLNPNNAKRGVIDYQSQAWVDSNGLIFAIVAVFAIREVCYIFGAVSVIMMFLVGLLREKEIAAEAKSEEVDQV